MTSPHHPAGTDVTGVSSDKAHSENLCRALPDGAGVSHAGPTSRFARTEKQKELEVGDFHGVSHPWGVFFWFSPLFLMQSINSMEGAWLIREGSRTSVVGGCSEPARSKKKPSCRAAGEMLHSPEAASAPGASASASPFLNSLQPAFSIPKPSQPWRR